MTRINKEVITNWILKGETSVCCLCFRNLQEEYVSLQDSVYLNQNEHVDLLYMLTSVLGHQHTENICSNDSICAECFKSIKFSYNFSKTCKENLDYMSNVVDSFNDCFKDIVETLDLFKTLFVSVNTEDFSSKQYYDSQSVVGGKSTAVARYKQLTFSKFKQRATNDVAKPRFHKYSNEMLKICNIIKKGTRSSYQCKVCDMIFSKTFNFKKHYFSQHSEKTFQCDECDRSYGSESLLKQHKYDSHATIICSQCGKSYQNRYSLMYHMRTHSGQKPYECKYCGKKFQWGSHRAEHIRQIHLEPSVTCDICQSKFRTLASFYMHRKKHVDPNSKYFLQQTPSVAVEEMYEETLGS